MELTTKQALQQAVAAHNAGNLQEAERAYQAILQSQPKHPDANHNLGLIAISANQIEAALPLLKTALDANSNVEQFWMSYIDALFKNNQVKDAKQAIKKAVKKGFNAKKLQALRSQLKNVSDNKVPSQELLISLLEHYQNGRLSEAEKLATDISQQFPSDNFSWKILAVIFKSTGRNSEAVDANQRAVALSPQDREAHYNFANTLKELGRLSEAEVSYKQAITLKPDYTLAHNNLGNTLQELGRLDEAEASYKQAIALKSDYAEAHSNLGVTLKELGRLDEAEASCAQAIALKPDYALAHSSLGNTLQELGRLDEAEASYKQAIALKPDFAEAYSNLGVTLKELGRLDEALASYTQAIALKPDYAEAHSNLSVTLKELGRLDEALASCAQAIALKPDYALAHNNLGITLKELGRLEEAEASYTKAIALKPDYALAHNNLGNTLQEFGKLDEALASYKQAIALKPDFVDGARNLVKLPVGQLDSDALNLSEKAFDISDGSLEYEIKYFFFQGNLLKHRGFIEQSFNLFCKANKLKLESSKDRMIVEAKKNSDSLMRIDKWMPSPPALAGKRLAKLFIVGPSKSGKSSVEHILNESSHVKALWEGIKYNELIKNNSCGKDLSEILFENIFSKSEGKLFNQGYKVVTSTNPESIFYSDYLMDMLPNAYFIIVKRDILDLSSEIFTSEYNRENLYSYDVNEISSYLDVYNRICETLVLKVPDRCLAVSFENIIQAPEDVVDQISRLVGSSLRVEHLKQNVASFEYESLFRNHYAALSDNPKC